MKLVRARFQLNIDVGTRIAAILSRVVASLDFEFLDCVNRGVEIYVIVAIVDHGDSVNIHLPPDGARAVAADFRSVGAGRVKIWIVDADAGSENGEVIELAPV